MLKKLAGTKKPKSRADPDTGSKGWKTRVRLIMNEREREDFTFTKQTCRGLREERQTSSLFSLRKKGQEGKKP